MGAEGWIVGEVDTLLGLLELSFCFGGLMNERFDLLFFLFQLLLLLFYLGSEFLNLLAQLFDSSQLCLTTSQKKCRDNVQRRLEFSDLFVP